MQPADSVVGSPRRRATSARVSATRLHETSVELEIPFHDVDALRVVWHGHYYKYLELARTRLFRSRRLDVSDLRDLRFRLVMIESSCRYAAPLRYGDRVCVSAWLSDVKHRIRVSYEVTNLTLGTRAARAHTVLVTLHPDGHMLLRTPDAILARLAPEADSAVTRGAGEDSP